MLAHLFIFMEIDRFRQVTFIKIRLYFISKRLYVHKMWTLNYVANICDPVGNV